MESSPTDTDSSVSQLEQGLIALQKSFESFRAQLDPFPHSFQLQNQESLQSDQLHRVKTALETALGVGYSTPLETARSRNLLAYVYFRLKRHADALSQAEKVATLEGQHQNLVTIANKAVILWHLQQRTLAQNEVQTLMSMKGLPEFPYLLVKAKAELAFSYTRFDPSFYPLAQTTFDEVIPQAQEPELWLWKFGLALTRRRMLRTSITTTKGSYAFKTFQSVLSLYLDIIQCCGSESLKAKVYADIAIVLFMPTSDDVRKLLQEQAGMTVRQACSSALRCDDKDNSVLWKCGKLYRYLRETEQSRDLLEKAVSLRETSQAYHHLGLTYEKLALAEKSRTKNEVQSHGEQTTNSNTANRIAEHFPQFRAPLSRCASSDPQPQGAHAHPAGQSSAPERSQRLFGGSACEDKQPLTSSPFASSSRMADKSAEEQYTIWKIAKSPRRGTRQFNEEDPYVKETIKSFTMAAKISEWENAFAIYDLARILGDLGKFEEAKNYLERTFSKEHTLDLFFKISIFEQLGLIFADMARKSPSEEDSKRLTVKSQSMLLMALKTASETYINSPADSLHYRHIWCSFTTLLETVDKNEKSSVGKLWNKAGLFRLIKDHEESLAILQDIRKMDPEKDKDPEYLKLFIENYVELQRFEDALVFVDLLQCTSQHDKTMELFEDPQFLHKVYLQAAKQSLLRGSPNFKSHFTAAFDCVDKRANLCTSSEDTDSGGERESNPRWDVHVLHEDTEEDTDTARGLVSTLTDLCGLRVTRMDDDVMPGFYLNGVYGVMRRSRVVVMMVRGGQKLSTEFRYFISMAARRPSSVSLLVHDGRLPKVLRGHRSMELPSDLQVTATPDPGALSSQGVGAVCGLFGFLAGIHITP